MVPALSVIVCTYNRQEHILNCLRSLRDQDCPSSRFEVIVVNDGSSDQTDERVRDFMTEAGPLQFLYEPYQPNKGLSFARNRGFELSKAPIISYVDDDAIMPPNFVSRVIDNFERHPDYPAMGGAIIPLYPHGEQEPDWMSRYIWGIVSKVDYGGEFRTFPKEKYPSGCNMMFRREVLQEVGGFDASLRIRSDDKYIFSRLREKGYSSILFCPNIPVRHNIEGERITMAGVIRVSRSVGRSERVRLGESFPGVAGKFMEYLAKMAASLLLAIRFLFGGQGLKGHYLVLVRWHILKGFFQSG